MENLSAQECLILRLDEDADLAQIVETVDELRHHVGLFAIGSTFASALLRELLQEDFRVAEFRLRQARELFQKLGGQVMWDLGRFPSALLAASGSLSPIPPKIVSVDADVGSWAVRRMVESNSASMTFVNIDSDMPSLEMRCLGVVKDGGARSVVCSVGTRLQLLRRVIEEPLDHANWGLFKNVRFICSETFPAWLDADQSMSYYSCRTPAEVISSGFCRAVVRLSDVNPPKGLFASRAEAVQSIVGEIASLPRLPRR